MRSPRANTPASLVITAVALACGCADEAPPSGAAPEADSTVAERAGTVGRTSAGAADRVVVRVRGVVISSGAVFVEAWDAPLTITLDDPNVIAGVREGVVGMRTGERRELRIPAERGYGQQGRGALIPPDADLRVEVELVQIIETSDE